jgi:hypothetical protein
LSFIEQSLSDSEFTDFILNGLDKEYESLIKKVTGRKVPITPQDLLGRLLNKEQRVEACKAARVYDIINHSAHVSYLWVGDSSPHPACLLVAARTRLLPNSLARLPYPPSTTQVAGPVHRAAPLVAPNTLAKCVASMATSCIAIAASSKIF